MSEKPYQDVLKMTSIIEMFSKAEALVRKNGFGWEIDWCERRIGFDLVEDKRFLHEYAWVVFNSGMKNRVVQKKWKSLVKAFRHFDYADIIEHTEEVREEALKIFGHKRKVEAVLDVCHKLMEEGFETIRNKIREDPLGYLVTLPFIGAVTKYHLARNLGFDFIKPDRHLVRLAAQYKMTPFELCNIIHEKTGRRLGTIDVILWRFCEQQGQLKL